MKTSRKFEKGYIAYKILSTDTGGAIIERHEITGTGYKDAVGTFMENGEEVSKNYIQPTVETTAMGQNVYVTEEMFLTLEEVQRDITLYLNRKKLW